MENLIEYTEHEFNPYGFTKQAHCLEENRNTAQRKYVTDNISITIQNLREDFITQNFNAFMKKWKEETLFSSNGDEIINNSNYEKIIQLGLPAIELILNDLKENESLWFTALERITGENPVPEEHIGFISKMAEDWINWGIENGFIE